MRCFTYSTLSRLLSASNPEGVAYVETMNLDGETNLKLRKALRATWPLVDEARRPADHAVLLAAQNRGIGGLDHRVNKFCDTGHKLG